MTRLSGTINDNSDVKGGLIARLILLIVQNLGYVVMGVFVLNPFYNRKDSRYSEKDAAKIVRQMLNVAARCHLNGVVHRDMKPEV
jgi:serine/threonine protein kinase